MKALYALLAAIWLLFGVTATAHAMPQTKSAPCHEMTAHHGKKAPVSAPDQGVMPCCSQPAALPAASVSLPALAVSPVRHEAPPPAAMADIVTQQDPRPPQNG